MPHQPVYDATVSAETYNHGPGLLHIYPGGSNVSLCGRVRQSTASGTSVCRECDRYGRDYVRRDWVGR